MAGSTTVALAMDFSSHSTIYGSRTFVILALEPSITAPVIDYVNEKLTSLANGSISFDGQNGTYETIASGERMIDPAWLGTTLWIVKKGDHSTVGDTNPRSFGIPNRLPAPGPLSARIDATPTGGTGAISGTTTAMEYSASATGPWTDCAAGSTTGLAQGIYYVRTKAVAGASFASEAATVTIGANTEKGLASFSLAGALGTIADVSATTGTITVTVPYGTDVTSLAPTFAHTGTMVTVNGAPQTSGASAQNFANPVTYTVTAADGSTKDYTVTVRLKSPPSALSKTGDGFPLGGLLALMGITLTAMCWLGARLGKN